MQRGLDIFEGLLISAVVQVFGLGNGVSRCPLIGAKQSSQIPGSAERGATACSRNGRLWNVRWCFHRHRRAISA